MSPDPRAEALRRYLEELHPGLTDSPALLPALDPATARQALTYLLELACGAQHIGNIELACRYLCAVPRDWLVANIEPVAEPLVALEEEWEFRRLLELYERLDPGLLERLAARGLQSGSEEIRVAAAEFPR